MQLLIAKPHLLHHTGAEVFNQNIRMKDQLLNQLQPLRTSGVRRHAFLISVHRLED